MNQQGCSISEAVKRSGVEAYVLRYWEEEGLLHVKRNRKGHRCYTEAEFKEIKQIQKLKDEGYTLKDIREIKEKGEECQKRPEEGDSDTKHNLSDGEPRKEEPAAAMQKKEGKTETNLPDVKPLSKQQEDLQKENEQKQFYTILERLVKEIALTRNREARFRRLDEAIRRQQDVRRTIAATEEKQQEMKEKKRKMKRKI